MMKFYQPLVMTVELSSTSCIMIAICSDTMIRIAPPPVAEPVNSWYKLVLVLLRTLLTPFQAQTSSTTIGYSLISNPQLAPYTTKSYYILSRTIPPMKNLVSTQMGDILTMLKLVIPSFYQWKFSIIPMQLPTFCPSWTWQKNIESRWILITRNP